jgi:hypothetical protein
MLRLNQCYKEIFSPTVAPILGPVISGIGDYGFLAKMLPRKTNLSLISLYEEEL